MSKLRLSINLVLNDELQSAAKPYDTKAITTSMVQTAADGLAVPAASQLAVKEMRPRLSGVVVIGEDNLLRDLYLLKEQHSIQLEPSAAAALSGPRAIFNTAEGATYIEKHGLTQHMPRANHIVWATGGALMPKQEFKAFWRRGKAIRA